MERILKEAIGAGLVLAAGASDCEAFVVKRESWAAAATALKSQGGFKTLVDLCGVDRSHRDDRFEVVAHLLDPVGGRRVRLRTSCPASEPVVLTLAGIYPNADWLEREAYDMFGIRFEGHPGLSRILCPQDFQGHPLRKDFAKA